MKKILTLLLLSALFVVPKSMQAVKWEVSDGTIQRINPVTKNPNDLVVVPQGTKFFYVYGYYPANSSTALFHKYLRGYSSCNFPCNTLRGRIIRALGYPSIESMGNPKMQYLIITEAEALAVKSLDLRGSTYGFTSGYEPNIASLEGLHVFKNLEELYLDNNQLVERNEEIGSAGRFTDAFRTWLNEEKAKKATDPTYYVPDIPESQMGLPAYYYTLFMRCFPKLKKLYLRGCNTTGSYCGILDFSNNTTLKELDITGSWFRHVILNGTNLTKLDMTNCRSLIYLDCKDANLDNLDLTGSDRLLYLNCKENNLTTLDLSTSRHLKQLYCSDNMLESITFNANAILNVVECQRNNLSSLTIPGSFFDRRNPRNLGWLNYDYTGNVYYEFDSNEGVSSRANLYCGENYIDCSQNGTLESLTLQGGAQCLEKLSCWNCKLTELNVTTCVDLKELRMSNNKVSSLDLSNNVYLKLITANNNRLSMLDCSNLTALQEAQLSRNKMTSLNMSGCSRLKKLLCNGQGGDSVRLLDTLNLTGCTALTTLECENNALTSLDLSTCTSLTSSGVKAYIQRAVKDVKVFDRNKVCIELPNGVTPTIANNSTITNTHMDQYFGTWTGSGFDKTRNKVIKRDGKTYLVLHDISNDARGGAQTKADVDFYGKQMKYQYALFGDNWDETLGGSLANGKKTDNVTVTTYPYVMYVNPTSADNHSVGEGNAPFYSGTIYLDYDAIVPAGTTAYIAKSIQIQKDKIYSTAEGGQTKVTADQLELIPLVAGEGASEVVIPALTPVYIKSNTETGLFSFDRNNHGGIAQPLGRASDGSHLIDDNILRGTLKDSVLRDSAGNPEKYRVLALGRGRSIGTGDEGYTSESRIGFWPSSRTSIPAHRVFIPMETLQNAGVKPNNSSGLLFSFDDELIETLSENNSFDFNKDGNVDVTDITAMINSIINGNTTAARSNKLNNSEDNTNEGVSNEISVTDVTSLINYIINMNKEVK